MGWSEIGKKELLSSSFSSIVNIEAEDLAPVNVPTKAPAPANFKSQDIGEILRVKKSPKAIMNKVSLVKTKELQLTTMPDLQLLVSVIIETTYKTDRAEVFAIFCKEVSRGNSKFRRLLTINQPAKGLQVRVVGGGGEEKELGQYQVHQRALQVAADDCQDHA